MKKGYLYLIFLALSGVVVFLIALIFKLSNPTHTSMPIKDNISKDSKNLSQIMKVQSYDNGWIGKIAKEKHQNNYFYPIEKFHIEFN